jgi:hypothetical protein
MQRLLASKKTVAARAGEAQAYPQVHRNMAAAARSFVNRRKLLTAKRVKTGARRDRIFSAQWILAIAASSLVNISFGKGR